MEVGSSEGSGGTLAPDYLGSQSLKVLFVGQGDKRRPPLVVFGGVYRLAPHHVRAVRMRQWALRGRTAQQPVPPGVHGGGKPRASRPARRKEDARTSEAGGSACRWASTRPRGEVARALASLANDPDELVRVRAGWHRSAVDEPAGAHMLQGDEVQELVLTLGAGRSGDSGLSDKPVV